MEPGSTITDATLYLKRWLHSNLEDDPWADAYQLFRRDFKSVVDKFETTTVAQRAGDRCKGFRPEVKKYPDPEYVNGKLVIRDPNHRVSVSPLTPSLDDATLLLTSFFACLFALVSIGE